ncbi:MAG: hypothetical protein HYS61_01075 [Acidobacteria bacterium]|nr:hypothetical protein [Acidobacteriota bacterium]
MNRVFLLWVAITLSAVSLGADTIFQINPQGRRTILHRDAVVVSEDSTSLVYKHFELKERRVVKVRLSKGSQPYYVDRSDEPGKQRIVSVWKRFGYRAAVTDLEGTTTQVFAAYLDFYPPEGRGSLLESVPPRTTLPMILGGGGADEFEFSRLAKIEFHGEHLKVTLRDGQVVEGRFLMPTDRPAEARILGITDQYNPASEDVFDFSLSIGRIKDVQFGK